MTASKGAHAHSSRLEMDIKQIQYFTLIYEARSFSRAAARASVAQPALSAQIRRLEQDLKIKLFNRTATGVEPTEAGHRLYERCLPVTESYSRAIEEMRSLADNTDVAGTIRVGIPGSFSRGMLSRILTPFVEQYPNVNISILEGYTGVQLGWVAENRVDFAIGARPTSTRGTMQRLLYSDQVVLMSGTPVHGANMSPIDLKSVTDLKLILPPVDQSFGGVIRDWIASGVIKVRSTIEINGTISSAEFARRSDWAVVTPFVSVVNEAVEERSSDSFFIYPIISPKLSFDLYLVYDERRPLSLAARRFIDRIETELRWLRAMSSRLPGSSDMYPGAAI